MSKRNTSKIRKVAKATRNIFKSIASELKADFVEGVNTVASVSVSMVKEIGPIAGNIGQAAKDGYRLGLETVQGSTRGAIDGANGSYKRVQRRIKRRKSRQ